MGLTGYAYRAMLGLAFAILNVRTQEWLKWLGGDTDQSLE